MKKKRVLVILGGESKEREISLESAKSCILALKKIGHRVLKFDPKFLSLSKINQNNPDLIFNALHGKGGEDGKVQSFFEYFGIPYTHTDNEIRYVPYHNNINLDQKIRKNKLTFPIVIKPNDEGSSIGVKICKNLNLLIKEFKKAKKNYSNLIFETYIPGQEIQVAVMGGKSIGAIELRPKRKFYDYKAKYKKSAKTLHIMPAPISKKKYKEVLKISEKANKILKCKGITRCDFRFYKNKFFLLEVNTQPGMTNLSLVPEIAKYSNISFVQLVKWMVNDSSVNR